MIGGVFGCPSRSPEENNHCYLPVRNCYLFMCRTLEVEGAVVMTNMKYENMSAPGKDGCVCVGDA